MKLELRLEDAPPDALREGTVLALDPIIGESGNVVGYRVLDATTDREIMRVPAEQVVVER
jgi:hypothetical protein